jgi:minor extracellular serine protease Vpr
MKEIFLFETRIIKRKGENMKKITISMLSLVLLVSMLASPALAQVPGQEVPKSIPTDLEKAGRPEPELVPQEIQDLFKDGMSVEEFLVWNDGVIPNALMDVVDVPIVVIVQLEAPSLISYLSANESRADEIDQASYVGQLEQAQQLVKDQILTSRSNVTIMGSYTKVLNGFMASVPAKDVAYIRTLPGVTSVTRAPLHEVDLATSVPLIKADEVWTMGDTGFTGESITVAVIDTGIDYTHAMFGTFGDPEAYALNDPDIIEAGSFPTPKVIGGYDFAGTNYNAAGSGSQLIPVPDPDPLDEAGHGTHVSSTVAGFDAGFGSGVAPDALLYALKVFGASGSTNLVIDAIEWAMDPNGDGFITDHVDVINMSLGSSFGPADPTDPEFIAVEAANTAGVFVVCSAGNAGNVSYVTGSPGNNDSALAVAASTTGFETLPYLSYNNGANKIPYTTSYNPFTTTITAELVAVDSIDGAGTGQLCSTTGVGDLTGKIALMVRGTCSFYIKVNNAAALGAVAAIIYNNTTGVISMDTSGSTLPAGSILQSDGLILKALAPLQISIGPDSNVTTFVSTSPVDTIASFSSRGPRGYDSMLKPEITAPGYAIFAADIGSGNLGVSMSGTSMAAPHMAGVVALMKQAHPSWSNEQIKAALMNTAVDLVGATSKQVPRQGAGRVDALAAVTTKVVAVGDAKLVSINWGVIEVTTDTFSSVKTVNLRNFSSAPVTLNVASMFTSTTTAGATLTPDVSSVTIPAYGKAQVKFTLTLDTTLLPLAFGYNKMEEYYGYVTFVGSDTNLRLPFYFVPRPYTKIAEVTPASKVTTFDANTEYGYIDLEQTGPKASSLFAYPMMMVSGNDPGVLDMADLRYVGMDYGWYNATYGDIFVPAFAMWDDQHANQPYWSEVDLYIDADRDGTTDVVNWNSNYGSRNTSYPDNQWIVLQYDYHDGKIYNASPYLIFADYNSGFQEWYLPAAWQYVTDTLDFEVISFDWFGNSDYAGLASFDITRLPFTWSLLDPTWSTWLDDPLNEPFSLVIEADDLAGYELSQPLGIMLVDYYGKPGVGQAYYWPLTLEDVTFDLTDLDLLSSVDLSTWTPVPGSFADGFVMPIDPTVPYYYLDTANLVVNRPIADGSYPFFLDQAALPVGYLAYWDAKGVNASADPDSWQGVMYQIITGVQPMFYLKVVGTSYDLIDGFQFLYAAVEKPLRLNGDYPLGLYNFTGEVADEFGLTDDVSVDITFLAPFALTDLDLFSSVNLSTWTLVPGNFADGFVMPIDPAVLYYYLDTDNLVVNRPIEDGSYPFYLDQAALPAGYLTYWAGKGVVSGATGWQGVMYQIITGAQPMFYLKVAGTSYDLIDGFQFLIGEGENPLRVNGEYPLGTYTFTGEVADEYGYTDDVMVDITFTNEPVAQDDHYTTPVNTPLNVPAPGVLANDVGPGLTDLKIATDPVSGPTHGSVTLYGDGSFIYIPDAGYVGPDSFVYTFLSIPPRVFDDQAVVYIDVTPGYFYYLPLIIK